MTFVADASALLALILGEPGWEFVRERVSSAIVHSANFAEVVDVAWRRATLQPDFVERQLALAGARVTPLAPRTARSIPKIRQIESRARSRQTISASRRLSLADCLCLAFATEHQLPVLTADRYWANLTHFGLEPEVVLIR